MYQVTIKGRTLDELKNAVADIANELGDKVLVNGMGKNLDTQNVQTNSDDGEEWEDVPSPYSQDPSAVMPGPVVAPEVVADATVQDVDKDGIPWDKRIHSSNKAILKNGTWRLKRGVDANTVAQVKAELLNNAQQAANPTPTPALPLTPSTPVVETPTPAPVSGVPTETAVASTLTPATPVAPAPVVAPAALPQTNSGHTFETFSAQFAMILGSLITEGKISQDYVNQLKDYFKLDQIWSADEAQKKEIFESFVGFGFIQKVG